VRVIFISLEIEQNESLAGAPRALAKLGLILSQRIFQTVLVQTPIHSRLDVHQAHQHQPLAKEKGAGL
jgi:hypothetical protein